MPIALVSDSTSDIPPELLQRYHIHIVPNILVINARSYKDGEGISRNEFYRLLPEMTSQPTTATASSGTYQELYDRLLSLGAEAVLSIHPSYLLSGIFNAASAAAQFFGERVRVIDSGSISLGLGFQVLAAAEAAAAGANIQTLHNLLADMHERIRVVAMLDTLEYIHRSGRVSWARARLGSLLRIKPFLDVRDGEVIHLGEVRTRRSGIRRLKDLLQQSGPFERLGILHSNAEEEAKAFAQELQPQFPTPILVVNVTTVIGTHVGPNALGFAGVVA
ncbi:MAG: DegV family protein [Anaerolineales bacterium]|jgi:DegV family protein with EDD domain